MMRIARVAAHAGLSAAVSVGVLGTAVMAAAQEVTGKPIPGGMGLQRGVTPIAREMQWMDNFLLVIITLIVIFVTALLAYTVWRFRASNNPNPPQRFTHNAKLEVIWTAIPVLILVIIAVPSLRLLFNQLDIPEPDVTIKATGYQWFWGFEYPEHGIDFVAYMLEKEDLAEYGYNEDEYLLATDNRVVVPVNANVHVLTTGADVIHNFALPAFGLKIDAIPGRLNETWFRAEEEGIYFGQCSELCGINHAYMPITIEVVSQEKYDAWVAEQVAMRRGEVDVAENQTAE
ncbi:MAG: cytochrome c oxidase subunit II [Pseudomonadota bacterium]